MLCDYGCGQEATFTSTTGRACCSMKYMSCPAVRTKNSLGVSKAHKDGRVPSDFGGGLNRGWAKGLIKEANFSYDGKGNHKGSLIQERGHRCENCNNTVWMNIPIPLELEHINGDNRDHRRENLLLLCCNCHALTPTWRGRNAVREANIKISSEDLITAIQSSHNTREALLKVGLVGKGGNYARVKRLLSEDVQFLKKEKVVRKNNSQYGKMWIHNMDLRLNKSVKATDVEQYYSNGWEKGRIMKFGQVAKLVETRET